jgi:ribose-phosphate pyrophosphokinase
MLTTIRRNAGIAITRFPDSQTHVVLTGCHRATVRLVWPIRSNDDLVLLMQISNALDGVRARKRDLCIPYLLGARSDRHMLPGDSADLRVVANCINACRFSDVHLFDVHSDVALQLIERSENHDNFNLVMRHSKPESVLICPDAGAAKKIGDYARWNPCFIDTVYCVKARDLKTGAVALQVLSPERCAGRHCVIIDDICDGGATFLSIAEQIEAATLTLIVTHGIFSKGLDALSSKFDRIITSDSYCALPSTERVTVVPLNI